MTITGEKIALTREINRLEKMNELYHKDALGKFIVSELARLRGRRVDLEMLPKKPRSRKKCLSEME